MLNRYTTKLNLSLFILIFAIYLFLGAQLFSSIERPTEQIIINEMSKTRHDFLEKYPCVKGSNAPRKQRMSIYSMLAEDDFESFIAALLEANKHGVDARTNFTT